MMHKRNLNETKSRDIDEVNDALVNVEPIEVLFEKFDVPIPRKDKNTKKTKIQRELKLNRKRKCIDSVQSKSKKWGCCMPDQWTLIGVSHSS